MRTGRGPMVAVVAAVILMAACRSGGPEEVVSPTSSSVATTPPTSATSVAVVTTTEAVAVETLQPMSVVDEACVRLLLEMDELLTDANVGAVQFGDEFFSLQAAAVSRLASSLEAAATDQSVDELRAVASRLASDEAASGDHSVTEAAHVELSRLGSSLTDAGHQRCANLGSVYDPDPSVLQGEAEVLAAAAFHRDLWEQYGFDVYTVQTSTFIEAAGDVCGAVQGPVLYAVQDGVVGEAVDLIGNCAVDPDHPVLAEVLLLTVDEMFDLIEEHAADVAVRFSEARGYPQEIHGTADEGPFGLLDLFLWEGHPRPEMVFDELEANRELWRSQGITDYRFTVQQGCSGCPPQDPEEFLVRGGIPNTASVAASVEQLFWMVLFLRHADGLQVSYDPEYGYPTLIRTGTEQDGLEISVTSFAAGS